ncbi:MAG: DNA repair protein RadC [Dehalococcoidia bacterium]|nr:DNA repair protein RadC [Dehalococcoidia bacterium]
METPGPESVTLIRDLPASDRPRERLRDYGAPALANSELIAILLRTGTAKESALTIAQRLLRDYGVSGLATAPFEQLCQEHGLGEAKAAQIKAALELGMRVASASSPERRRFTSPADIADARLIAEMSAFEQEHVRVLLLDTRGHMLGFPEVYVGNINSAQVRMGELLRDAVRVNACSVVLVHNHPSGDATPSEQDVLITEGLREAGALMGIAVHDHIIIGGGRYLSMKSIPLGFGRGR